MYATVFKKNPKKIKKNKNKINLKTSNDILRHKMRSFRPQKLPSWQFLNPIYLIALPSWQFLWILYILSQAFCDHSMLWSKFSIKSYDHLQFSTQILIVILDLFLYFFVLLFFCLHLFCLRRGRSIRIVAEVFRSVRLEWRNNVIEDCFWRVNFEKVI
jgi:hypothetical protein